MRTTTNADRYVSRARFSASDRPVPADLDVVAAIRARRAKRTNHGSKHAWLKRLARPVASTVARLAGVRRSASIALTLLLATGVGSATSEAAERAPS